jgi:basic amino acid/polyamine antiporter, APA family
LCRGISGLRRSAGLYDGECLLIGRQCSAAQASSFLTSERNNMSAEASAQQPAAKAGLTRTFGLREAVTITAGSVIGVGLFTTGSNVVGTLGTAVILATLLALAVSIYPALLYGEMGAALPYAGGTYQFASLGLGRAAGVLAGWNFIISLVAVTGGEALAFSYYFKTIFLAFGVELPISDVALASIVTAGFIVANVFGVGLTGRLQNAFMFFFWGVAVIWFLTMIPNVSLPAFVKAPSFLPHTDAFGFFSATCMIWWCFAGFEACVAMGEEIKYPHINVPRAMMLAPFVVFAVNALFQWYLIGITPSPELPKLAEADAPFAQAMISAGILGFPLALLAAGIAFGGDFSTLNASISTPPRYLFSMARDGSMPKVFAITSKKYNTPYVAVITLGILSIALIATDSLIYIASLSLFADLFYYVIGILAALALRRKHPELYRPYKAPAIAIGAPVSAVIYVLMMTQLDTEAFVTGIAWCVLGLVIYFVCSRRYGSAGEFTLDLKASGAFDEPSAEEKRSMDREYTVWKTIVGAACAIALALYALPFFTA